MKKILAILLASLLLLSLLPAAVAEIAEEPVVIKAMWESARPQNAYTDEVHDYILKTLNIDLQLTCVSENFTQQLALAIASGDIPDLILMEYRTYVEYAKEGLFADLTGLVDNYPDLMEYVNTGDQGEVCWNRMKVDGAIYGVPTRSVNTTMLTTAIRQDWLDNLNLQVPTTIDELTEVLRAFTEDDPDQNGLNDTYGLSTYGMHNIYSMSYLSTIFGAFGATPGQEYLLNDDGTVTTNVISDEYKAAVSYLHDIYAAGYMDPEVFTNSNSQAYEKFATGKMGFWPCWWSNPGSVYVKYGFLDNCPTGKITLMDPIVGPDGKSGLIGTDPIWRVLGITSSCQNVEKVLELINWQCTPYGWYTCQCGVEGNYFEMDADGNVTWYWGMDGKNKNGDDISDMELYKFIENLDLQSRLYKLDESNYGQYRAAGLESCMNAKVYQNLFNGIITDEYTKLNSELESYMDNNITKFIMGELDLSKDWDNFVSTYLSMGGEQVRTSLLNAYNEANGTTYTFR